MPKIKTLSKLLLSVVACGVVILMAVALVGCGENPTDPSVININIHNDNQNNNGGGTPSPSPNASSRKPDSVKIAQFGESGCASPSGAQRTVKVGCTAAITCSPLIGGAQAPAGTFPEAPDSFGLKDASSNVRIKPSGVTAYNLDVEGVSPGSATFECIVNGVSNVQTAGAFTLTVVPQ